MSYVVSYGVVVEVTVGGARTLGHFTAVNPFAPVVPRHRFSV